MSEEIRLDVSWSDRAGAWVVFVMTGSFALGSIGLIGFFLFATAEVLGTPRQANAGLLITAAQLSMPQIREFPRSLLTLEHASHGTTAPMKCVTGLGSALVQCYDQAILPAEHGALAGSAAGDVIDLSAPSWNVDGEPERVETGAALPNLATASPSTD